MLRFVTAADVTPTEFSDWYLFNTWLQRKTGQQINLHIPVTFQELHERIEADKADIVYANPYDAAMLVRDNGFIPVARPDNHSDEVVIVTHKDSKITDFAKITPLCHIALTDDRDVHMIGMILIEPSDLEEDSIEFVACKNSIAVAKNVLNKKANIGFLLTKSYDGFSRLIKSDLRELIRSQISVINHTLMVKQEVLAAVPNLAEILADMHNSPNGKPILDKLDINKWLQVEAEETEFMIDLMETLK